MTCWRHSEVDVAFGVGVGGVSVGVVGVGVVSRVPNGGNSWDGGGRVGKKRRDLGTVGGDVGAEFGLFVAAELGSSWRGGGGGAVNVGGWRGSGGVGVVSVGVVSVGVVGVGVFSGFPMEATAGMEEVGWARKKRPGHCRWRLWCGGCRIRFVRRGSVGQLR